MDNIILNIGDIDNAKEFESHARELLFNLSECAPYGSRITASVNKVGEDYVVSLRVKSRDLDLRDTQIDSSPYMALDLVSFRIRDEIYSWWYRRFDYVSCLSS